MKRTLLLLTIALIVTCSGCSRRANPDAAAAEKQFQAMMAGATLVGHSTSRGRDGLSGEERYAIEKISKVGGDTWLLQARMHFGSHDVPVPIPVVIKWAGDTPVITLTDLSIPGLGTYTARVLLYRDQYAGTWSAKDHGGQLFGKIVRSGQ